MNSSLFLHLHIGHKALRVPAAAVSVLLAVMFPVGIIGMASGMLAKQHLWTASLFLGVQAALTFVVLWDAASFVRALLITVMIGTAAAAVEFVGLATGFPFGSYYYSYNLEPFVVSNVPLAIVFAWYILSVNIVLLYRTGTPGIDGSGMKIVAGGLLLLGIDIMLEPFASFVNRYWTWAGGVIPMQNYTAWFVIGTLFIAAVHAALPRQKTAQAAGGIRLPDAMLMMTAAQCAIINTLNGYWIATAAGISIAAAAYWRLRHGRV